MSLSRAVLVCIQALCYHMAMTPPHPTSSKLRYHTNEASILQIAPVIFIFQKYIFWFFAIIEVTFYTLSTHLHHHLPPTLVSFLFPPQTTLVLQQQQQQSNIQSTPLFLIGVFVVVIGTYIRLDCYRALGHLFTFDLTVLPDHKLVTDRFYAYVRHPSYAGSMLLIVGLTFSHLTPGSWLMECVMPSRLVAFVVGVVWWGWTWSVGISRADAEDKEMRKVFGVEWDEYAARVPCWFFPGVY